MFRNLQFVITSAALLAACGDDGGQNVTIVDGGGSGGDAANVACKASSSYGSPTPSMQEAHSAMDSMGNQNLWVFLDLNADASPDIMLVDLYAGYGAFQGGLPAAGATVQLTGDEVSPATCGACVSIQVDYTEQGPADDIYLADGGMLTLTAATTTSLAGSLSNVTFKHMNVDSEGIATPHPDNCTATLASIAFSATPMPSAAAARSRFQKRDRR
ncbi:MAG: hypothetical protein ACKV2T_42380 [Kofleriaceae bacterium]